MNSSKKSDENTSHLSSSKDAISKLLLAFAEALDSMSSQEFDLLIQGKSKLRLAEGRRIQKKTRPDSVMDQAVSDIAEKLRLADSRESAAQLLASINQPRRRSFLLLLAKECGVRPDSKDNIQRIEQRLVENVVGSRLDSEAIRKVAF